MSNTTHHFHAVVWIDHREAKVFEFNRDAADESAIRAHSSGGHLHHKAGAIGDGKVQTDQKFLASVADAVASAGAILITGPGNTKTELLSYLGQNRPDLAKRVVATEASDHPSDAQIVAHARKYFHTADRMTPQRT